VSIVGLRMDQGGHNWEVTAARREGPEWRITLRSAGDPRCRLVVYIEGPETPGSTTVTRALAQARYRWFVDNQDRVWRAEVSPRYELGTLRGHWVVFSAEDGPDREKYSADQVLPLGALPDIRLLELLLRARKGL